MRASGDTVYAPLAVVVNALFEYAVTGFSASSGGSGIEHEGVFSESGVKGF